MNLDVLVIGGGEIYAAALPLADRVYLTLIHATPAGDTTFPRLDPAHWRLVSQEPIPQGPKDDYAATLMIYERIGRT
jgi:dihydrofolate reductase